MSALLDHRPPIEKVLALAVAVAPAVWLAGLAFKGELGTRPVTEAIRISGDWALRLLWLALLISPARRILAAPRLIRTRRILGLGAFGLTALHFGLYALDQQFDWGEVGLEILLRTYLTIGTAATIGLAVLAATSSNRAVLKLGGANWNRLHRSVYAIAGLSLIHFLLRSRTDTFEPMLMFGLFAWLMGYRVVHRYTRDVTPTRLTGLAVAAALLTAAAETSWHAAATGVDAWRILAAHLDIAYGLRPAWWVLAAGIAAGVLSRMLARQSHGGRPRCAPSPRLRGEEWGEGGVSISNSPLRACGESPHPEFARQARKFRPLPACGPASGER
jgi:methionine sulfoxide reductase heme-binding subunit